MVWSVTEYVSFEVVRYFRIGQDVGSEEVDLASEDMAVGVR